MFKRIVAFFKKYLHFKIVEIPLVAVFIVLINSVFYCVSNLPNERNNYIAQEISVLSKQSETGSVPIYFEQDSNTALENSYILKEISNFNNYNNTTSGISEYKQLVCANLDNKEVTVNALEDKNPAVIMTSWATYYYDKTIDDNIFMADLMVEGLGTSQVSDHYFCYINSKQADYLIEQNPEYNSHRDLINQKLTIKITYDRQSETKDFLIRDIIKSDVGNDSRYTQLFESYIVCYYLPFLNTTKYQMFYDFAKDENRNLTKLNEIKNNYSPEVYSLKFLNSIDEKTENTIKENFLDNQSAKDNTVLVILLLFIPGIIFSFSVFFVCESNSDIKLSIAVLLFGIFAVEYVVVYFLSLAKVMFIVKIFTSSGILFNFSLLLLTLLMIAISAFIKETTKFSRKYVNEKRNK